MIDDTTRQLLDDACARAIAYLDGLNARPVAPHIDAVARLVALDTPLPAYAGEPADTLRVPDELGSPARGTRTARCTA